MIIRIVKMTFKPERINDFKAIFEASKEKIRDQNGCNYLCLLQDKNNTSVFFTYSYWDNEIYLNHYRNSNLFGHVCSKTRSLDC